MARTIWIVALFAVLLHFGSAAVAAPIAMSPDPVDFVDLSHPESINITLSSGDSSPASLTFTISTLSASLTHGVDVEFAFDSGTTGASSVVNLGTVNGLSVSSGTPTSSLTFSCDFQMPCELDVTYTFALVPSTADIISNTGPMGAQSVAFEVLPEPSTGLLFTFAFGVLVGRRKRWRWLVWCRA
ncbi:MAG: PEP-CTERM sorting domain-containing protein [Myxococcota bacterium]